MNSESSNDRRSTPWAGVCAGGYFAMGAAYLANALVLAAVRDQGLVVALLLVALTVACGLIGSWVLAEKRWVLKGAVVAAGAFAGIHLIGLVFIFYTVSATEPLLTRSLQWQLGTVFLFVWLANFGAALRLVRCHRLAHELPR